VEALLDGVDEHHKTFDFIHVATAVTRIAKLARQQRRSGGSNAVIQDAPLASDERYVKLMGLVVQTLQSFQAREAANVFSGLATLQVECGVAADADLLVKLGAAIARVAPDMNDQGVANTLNAYAKLEEAAAEMPRSLRDALAEVVERVAPDMNAQGVANTLNAYSKLEEAAAEMPRSLRDALAAAAERVAPDMNAQAVANTLNAYSKLEEAAAEMPRSLRDALAQAAERVAPSMNAQAVGITLNAYSKLEEAAAEMPRSLRGALAEAAERVAPDMNAQSVANTLNAGDCVVSPRRPGPHLAEPLHQLEAERTVVLSSRADRIPVQR